MKTRFGNNMHMAVLVFCALIFPNSAVFAQICGDLEEKLCAYVSIAVANWNQRFGETARITEWSFIENTTVEVNSLVDQLDAAGDGRLPTVDSEGQINLVPISTEAMEQWREAERQHLLSIIGDNVGTVNLVNLDWETRDGTFSSTLVANDRNPFLHERALSSIVLEHSSNSCLNIRLAWLWGRTRGEIFAALPRRASGDCARASAAWMTLGSAEIKMGEIMYNNGTCSSAYAWAYATPLVSASFSNDNFSFTITGLGSRGTGNGDCLSP